MTDRPNCHKCKFSRQSVVSSTTHHRSCRINVEDTKVLPEITLIKHGVMQGWCSWPYDFDPVWVDRCTAFEEKTE